MDNKTISKEAIFNKYSFEAIGAISPSKDFCLKAMDQWAKQVALAFVEIATGVSPEAANNKFDEFYQNYKS